MNEDMYGPELKELWVAAGYNQDSFALHLKQSPIAHLGIGISAPTLSKLVTQNLKVPDMLAAYVLTTMKARPGRQARFDACRATWREKKAASAASEPPASVSATGSAPAEVPSVEESLASTPGSKASAVPSLDASTSDAAPAASAPEPRPTERTFAKGSSERVWTRRVRLYRRARRAFRGRGVELALVAVLIFASGALVYGHEEAKYSMYLGRLLETALLQGAVGVANEAASVQRKERCADNSRPCLSGLASDASNQMGKKEPAEKWIPPEALEGQKPAKDCDPSLGEKAINGGCWVPVAHMAPPCGKLFRNGDECYRPVAADPNKPVGTSSARPAQ